MRGNQSNFFWASYSDLMTSLFFVMFVLFMITIGIIQHNDPKGMQAKLEDLKIQIDSLNKKARVSEQELKSLKELEYPSKYIDNRLFEYEKRYKRFSLIRDVKFEIDQAVIKQQDLEVADKIGESIINMITQIRNDSTLGEYEPKYMVIIEGMASKDVNEGLRDHNYRLSYERAYSLYKHWKRNPRISSKLANEDICEVIIAGSGWGGVGRIPTDGDDSPNQRFLIQIIPKINTTKR